MCCYVVLRIVLGAVGEDYPNLTTRQFLFFMSGQDWEFPTKEVACHEFPIHDVWGVVPKDKEIGMALTEQGLLKVVYTWVEGHQEEIHIEVLLTTTNMTST